MSTSRREQILAALATRLAALEDATTRVQRNRDVPVQWPGGVTRWLVFLDGTTDVQHETAASRIYLAHPIIEAHVLVGTAPDDFAAAVDALYLAVLPIIVTASTDHLGGLAIDVREEQMTVAIARDPGGPTAGFELQLAIPFAAAANDPTQGG